MPENICGVARYAGISIHRGLSALHLSLNFIIELTKIN